MERWKKRSVEMIFTLLFGGNPPTFIEASYPQKTEVSGREERYFPRTVPEKQGISSRRIYNMLCELEGERRADVHSIMVLRGGEVISECSAAGYSVNEWHISHSMSKTICGMIIGRLVDDGMLCVDTPLVEIFPEIPYRDRKFPLITINHLLAMTSGVDFAEAGAITESDWMTAFFSSAVKFTPGAKFAYNSMNRYILVCIAERISDRRFSDLAEDYIFAPLGIENYFWEKSPGQIVKGGWGLYMSPESWLKLGYMLRCGGVFDGKRILSEEWVKNSSTVKVVTPSSMGNFNYAYQMWTGRDNSELLFNGMLGQNVWICPHNDIVVVITSGNNEFFQESPALDIIRKYLGGRIDDRIDYRDIKMLASKQNTFFNCRCALRPREPERGLIYFLKIKSRTPFDERWNDILGKYVILKNNAGIMPLILRVMQNNLATVIEKIELSRVNEDLLLTVNEVDKISITVGLYGYKKNVCKIGRDIYIIRAMGEVGHDIYGGVEYKIELVFSETANKRIITIKQSGEGRIRLELSECPDHQLATNVLRRYRETTGVIAFAADMLERRMGEGEVEAMIKKIFNPVLIGISLSLPNCDKMVYEENNSMPAEGGAVKIMRSIVDRFFKDNDSLTR